MPQGGSITFTVAGYDANGHPVDTSGVVLTSSVSTDVINGLTVTFPTASPHVITARLGSVSASVTIEVIPPTTTTSSPTTTTPAPPTTPAPTPAPTPTSAVPQTLAPGLPTTGASSSTPTLVAAVLLLAGLGMVAITRHPATRRRS